MSELQIAQGYEPSIFVVAPNDKFTCAICLHIVRDARQCVSNGHCFCLSCITFEKTRRNVCPVCSCPIYTLAKNTVLDALVKEMVTKCKSQDTVQDNLSDSELCEWTGPLLNREDHHVNYCWHFPIKCPHAECPEVVQRRLMADHIAVCEHKTITCPHCSVDVTAAKLAAHDAVCRLKPVPCPCGVTVPQSRMKSHTANDCPSAQVQCPLIAAGICSHKPSTMARRQLLSHVVSVTQLTHTGANSTETGNGGATSIAATKGKRKVGAAADPPSAVPSGTSIHTRSSSKKK